MFKALGRAFKDAFLSTPDPSNTLSGMEMEAARYENSIDYTRSKKPLYDGSHTKSEPSRNTVQADSHTPQARKGGIIITDFSDIPNANKYSLLTNFIFANMRQIKNCSVRRSDTGISGKVEGLSSNLRGEVFSANFTFECNEVTGEFKATGGYTVDRGTGEIYKSLSAVYHNEAIIMDWVMSLVYTFPLKDTH